jgi:DnaJ-class molecular chaperone
MRDPEDDTEADDEPTPCDTCGGHGDVGPYGWEYPEYDTCPDCKGSGLERDHEDPDRVFEERAGK